MTTETTKQGKGSIHQKIFSFTCKADLLKRLDFSLNISEKEEQNDSRSTISSSLWQITLLILSISHILKKDDSFYLIMRLIATVLQPYREHAPEKVQHLIDAMTQTDKKSDDVLLLLCKHAEQRNQKMARLFGEITELPNEIVTVEPTLLELGYPLNYIIRYRTNEYWQSYNIKKFESVADHCGNVLCLVFILSPYLGLPQETLSHLLHYLVIHDIDEVIIGDLCPIGKNGNGQDTYAFSPEKRLEKDQMEENAMKLLLSYLRKETVNLCSDVWAQGRKSPIIELARAIDTLEASTAIFEMIRRDRIKMDTEHSLFSTNYLRYRIQQSPNFKTAHPQANRFLTIYTSTAIQIMNRLQEKISKL